jgi:hypothetical protein
MTTTTNNNPPVGDISGVTNPPHPHPGNPPPGTSPTTPPPPGVNKDAADTNINKNGKPKFPKNKNLVEQEEFYTVRGLFFV